MDRHSLSQPTYYHEVSDDDEDLRAAIQASQASFSSEINEDEALKAAIAASLADTGPQTRIQAQAPPRPRLQSPAPAPKQRPVKRSAFQNPDDLFRLDAPSSPPEVEILEIESREIQIEAQAFHREGQQAPRSSPPSSQVRDETKRMLDELDAIALNSRKRNNEEVAEGTKKKAAKKAGAENTENSNAKPRKRAALTQEERVFPLSHAGVKIRILGLRYKQRNKSPKKPNDSRR